MPRVRMMQPWFALSDPVVEGALCEIASLRSFARRMHQVEKATSDSRPREPNASLSSG